MKLQDNFNSLSTHTVTKDRSKKVENFSMLLFILCFISPVVFALLIAAISSPEAQKYGSIQFIVMGIYNLPAVAIGLLGLILGKVFSTKNQKASKLFYIVSIVASVIGIGIMASWFLSAYFS